MVKGLQGYFLNSLNWIEIPYDAVRINTHTHCYLVNYISTQAASYPEIFTHNTTECEEVISDKDKPRGKSMAGYGDEKVSLQAKEKAPGELSASWGEPSSLQNSFMNSCCLNILWHSGLGVLGTPSYVAKAVYH